MSAQSAERLDDIRAVSFDLDDTFWDCAPAIRHAELTTYAWLERHAPRITSRYTESALAEQRMAFYAERPALRGDVTAMRKASFADLFKRLHYPESLADEAFAVFYRARSEVTLYTGVHELLTALGARYRVAAITNGNADLGLIGIDHYFHSIHHATLTQPAKPAPAMFEACLARFDLAAPALLHVGDNPETDVGGAHNAGVHACWYNPTTLAWPESQAAPRLTVHSLDELRRLLA